MKRWLRKVEPLGARMELREHADGWSCYLVPVDAPPEPVLRPRTGFATQPFRDAAIRAALASYASGGLYHRPTEPIFCTFAEHYAHATGGRRHPW